jgi:hypothetical protein
MIYKENHLENMKGQHKYTIKMIVAFQFCNITERDILH